MRSASVLSVLLLASCLALVSARGGATLNPRPVIGIFTLANSDNPTETGSIIPAAYVKWLEQGGARVAVIPFNAPRNVLDQLFDGINGLLYTGGGLSLDVDTVFFQNALYLFNKAKAVNDAGDVFPIWGSCQGFQMMHLLAARPRNHNDILKCLKYDSTNIALPLDFTEEAVDSQLFGPMRKLPAYVDGSSSLSMYDVIATENITMNLHNCGVDPRDFYNDPVLPNFYRLTSTNVDLKGLPFVSSIEGIKYPFWATQWHAERTQYEWGVTEKLAHTAQSVAVHSYVAQRWMMLARQSSHRFPTPEAEAAALIFRYLPTYSGSNAGSMSQTYRFTFNFLNGKEVGEHELSSV